MGSPTPHRFSHEHTINVFNFLFLTFPSVRIYSDQGTPPSCSPDEMIIDDMNFTVTVNACITLSSSVLMSIVLLLYYAVLPPIYCLVVVLDLSESDTWF